MNLIIKIIRHPRKAFKAFNYRLLSALGHSNFKRFIVLSRSRTGSSMLITFLNSHPNIHAVWGIFQTLNGRNYKDVLAKTFGKEPYYIKAKGFKIFYYHPEDDKSNDIWEKFMDMDNLRVIHLKRRNILCTLISRKIAGIQDVWLVSSPDRIISKNKAVTFTVKELEEGFEQTRKWEKYGDEMFKNHPLVSVYYEDLENDPEGTFGKITDFLDVRYVRPKTNLSKLNPERLRDLVINYNELKTAFSGTEWQPFFEE
ncbi:sulfotransferase [Chloroflexota bacterium]